MKFLNLLLLENIETIYIEFKRNQIISLLNPRKNLPLSLIALLLLSVL